MKLLLPMLIALSLFLSGCYRHYHHDEHRDGPGHSEDAPGHNKHKHNHHGDDDDQGHDRD